MTNSINKIDINSTSTLFVNETNAIDKKFFDKTVKSVVSKLKKFCVDANFSFDANCNKICLDIIWGTLQKTGSSNNLPWTEAWDVPDLIKSMDKIGFKISYFQIYPESTKTVKGKKVKIESSLSIGFIKKVPKSKFV